MARAVVTLDGRYLGVAPEFRVDSPWWADVEPVAAHLTARLGTPANVLRLLDTTSATAPRDGLVSYHVEVAHAPVPGTLDTAQAPPDALFAAHPLRAAWANPGGPAALAEWARAALAAAGRSVTGPAEQTKTWNLSCLLRLPTDTGPVWAKATAPFTTPESTVIGLVAEVDPGIVPPVLAGDPDTRRVLLAHVDGADCWGADADTAVAVVRRWVAAQAALAGRASALPRVEPADLADRVRDLVRGPVADDLTPAELADAEELIDTLPRLLAEAAGAGLPATVVHGDFHCGNWRSDGDRHVVVDWSDARVDHPALDLLRLRDFLAEAAATAAEAAWVRTWREHVPSSDPSAALRPLEPVAHLRAALRYQEFLDGIEESERRYHEGDPAAQLRLALAANHRRH
ncbi:phosphotransferase [Solihabitans fulvus]|uniref:Phosphotransferase n=1 Tax=Solihabitans fulvus TaxID=1892852 RepID=A0A5B2X7T2_9PSEU|nr:phosphotransferase [Solihabitans fulvus]